MMFGGESDFDDTAREKPNVRADGRALLVWGGFLAVCAALVLGQAIYERSVQPPPATQVAEAD